MYVEHSVVGSSPTFAVILFYTGVQQKPAKPEKEILDAAEEEKVQSKVSVVPDYETALPHETK